MTCDAWTMHERGSRGSEGNSIREFCCKRSRKVGQALEKGVGSREDFSKARSF